MGYMDSKMYNPHREFLMISAQISAWPGNFGSSESNLKKCASFATLSVCKNFAQI